jgi:hypothetical protein
LTVPQQVLLAGVTASNSATAWVLADWSHWPGNAQVAYQWQEKLPDGWGLDIPGATGQGYKLAVRLGGQQVRVCIKAALTGWSPGVACSPWITARPWITLAQISGTGRVGSVLSSVVTTAPPTGATVKYQWYRGATAISGATAKTYTVKAADAGFYLLLKATVTAGGLSLSQNSNSIKAS